MAGQSVSIRRRTPAHEVDLVAAGEAARSAAVEASAVRQGLTRSRPGILQAPICMRRLHMDRVIPSRGTADHSHKVQICTLLNPIHI